MLLKKYHIVEWIAVLFMIAFVGLSTFLGIDILVKIASELLPY